MPREVPVRWKNAQFSNLLETVRLLKRPVVKASRNFHRRVIAA